MPELSITDFVPKTFDDVGTTLQRLLALQGLQGPSSGTALASAARTTTTASANISTNGKKYLFAVLNVTAVTGAPSLTFGVRWVNPIDGQDYTLFSVTAAITAVGRQSLCIGPGINSTLSGGTSSVTATGSLLLPAQIKLQVNHGTADSVTYSVTFYLA